MTIQRPLISTTVPTNAMFDVAVMSRLVDGDQELLQITGQAIAEDISERLTSLQQAFQAQNQETLTREVHTLKSHAATAGAQELRNFMQALEERCLQQHALDAEMIAEIHVRYLALQSALQKYFTEFTQPQSDGVATKH